MEKQKLVKLVHRELRVLLKLVPWMLVSLLLAAVLWRTDTAAISGLFQSVQSPVATDTALPPTAIPTQEPTLAPTVLPTEGVTVMPTVTQVVTATAPITPTETATPAVTATSVMTPTTVPTATPTPLPRVSPTVEATVEGSGHYPGEDPTLAFDWGVLFDSVALGISYIWLCCGILFLVSIPVVFVILWVVSKRRREQQE